MDIRLFAALRDRELRREGILVAEGRLLAERLLRSGLPVLGVLCAPRFEASFLPLSAGACPLRVLPEREIARIAGFAFHRGVLAVARRPEPPALEALLPTLPAASLLLACPDLTDPENLGSVIRSSAALGADAVLLGPRSCDPWSRRALKVAMGASFSIPVVRCENEGQACGVLRAGGYTVAGASLSGDAQPLEHYRRPERLCLVLGNEAEGLGEPWRSCCDVLFTIPMHRGTD